MTLMTTPLFRGVGMAVLAVGVLWAGRSPRPAVIIDATGATALVRGSDGTMTLLGRSRSTFTLQQWLPGDRDARAPRDPTLTAKARCDASGCTTLDGNGKAVALVVDPAAFSEDCERAAVIISPLAAPKACSETATVYDRSHFAAYGATYVYAEAGATRLETARNPRQNRPWTRPARTEAAPAPAAIPSAPKAAAEPIPTPGWDPGAPDEPEREPLQ